MKHTDKYGKYQYCVKVSEDLAEEGEIYLMADEVKVYADGSVAFIGNDDYKGTVTNLLIPSGKWNIIYAASVIDGSAVAVDRWDEEVIQSG